MSVPGDRLPLPFPFPGGLPRDLGESHALEDALRALDEARRERGAPPLTPDEIEDERVNATPGAPTDPYDANPLPPGGEANEPRTNAGDSNIDTFPTEEGEKFPEGPPTIFEPGPPLIFDPGPPVLYPSGPPRAFEGQRAPVPPALLQLQRRPSRPSASRVRERARPKGLQGFPSALLGVGMPGALRIPLPSRSRTSGAVPTRLAFRGPRVPRTIETETTPIGIPIPYPYPQKIGKPRDEGERGRARELLDKIKRGESIFPLPDVNRTLPPSPRPPIRVPAPQEEPQVPLPQPQAVPSRPIPAPGPVTQPGLPPLPSPAAPGIPIPRPPPAPPKPAPARRKPGLRTAQGLGLASILRPILRRRDQTHTSLLSRFTAPFDPVTDPIRIGDPIAPPPATSVPPRIAEPDLQPLTPDNALRLTLNPQATGTRRKTKEDECNCEEEKEARRRPSSKIAAVKAYRRRMSQNSLDNLRN